MDPSFSISVFEPNSDEDILEVFTDGVQEEAQEAQGMQLSIAKAIEISQTFSIDIHSFDTFANAPEKVIQEILFPRTEYYDATHKHYEATAVPQKNAAYYENLARLEHRIKKV